MEAEVPKVRLVAVGSTPAYRELGWARGEFMVPDDFDAPLPADIEDRFYGVDETPESRRGLSHERRQGARL
jgi:hypothetical protein